MSTIILPSRWRRQPSALVGIDSGNALAQGLVGAWLPIGQHLHDATGRVGQLTGTATTPVGTALGLAHNFASAKAENTAQTAITNLPMTLSAFVYTNRTSGVDQRILTVSTGTTANDVLGIRVVGATGKFDAQHYDGATQSSASIAATAGAWVHVVGVFSGLGANARMIYAAGVAGTSDDGNSTVSPSGIDRASIGYAPWGGGTWEYFDGQILAPMIWNRALSVDEIREVRRNPWQVFKKSARILYFPSAGGGATITGSGTPTAQASTVSGTAERSVTGSGTPTAQASTVAGVAERVITSSGALASQSSAVAGSGSVGNAISGSGTLLAQSSQVAGTAERSVTGSGTPASQSATVSGAAERIVTGTGTPTSQSSTVSGTGQVGNVVTGSGSPTAQSATVSGTAERTVTSSGALSAQSSTVAGTAERTITGSGALSAQSSTVYGFDSAPVVPDTGGGGSRTVAFSSRKLRQELEEWEQKNQEKERLKRLMREDEELVLIMLALAA